MSIFKQICKNPFGRNIYLLLGEDSEKPTTSVHSSLEENKNKTAEVKFPMPQNKKDQKKPPKQPPQNDEITSVPSPSSRPT